MVLVDGGILVGGVRGEWFGYRWGGGVVKEIECLGKGVWVFVLGLEGVV